MCIRQQTTASNIHCGISNAGALELSSITQRKSLARFGPVCHTSTRHDCAMGAMDTGLFVSRYYGCLIVELYNEQRPHQGRWCFGKTAMQTFLESVKIAEEKQLAA